MTTTTDAPATSIPALTLGWRMQMALRHAGVSVHQMADELGMSRSQLSRWLGDRGTPPRAAYVRLWAMRCGVPYEWLAHGLEPQPDPAPAVGLEPTTCRFGASTREVLTFRKPIRRLAEIAS